MQIVCSILLGCNFNWRRPLYSTCFNKVQGKHFVSLVFIEFLCGVAGSKRCGINWLFVPRNYFDPMRSCLDWTEMSASAKLEIDGAFQPVHWQEVNAVELQNISVLGFQLKLEMPLPNILQYCRSLIKVTVIYNNLVPPSLICSKLPTPENWESSGQFQ